MDERTKSIIDNVSSVTISRTAAEQLQHTVPFVRKGAKRNSNKPTDSEVQSMAIDQRVWATAKDQAEQIAAHIVANSREVPASELGAVAIAKVRSVAAKLLVIEDDATVTVYNNLSQASKARAAKRAATKATYEAPVTD